jgi:transcriptional regulator with PAS, ATPase and Fis domain
LLRVLDHHTIQRVGSTKEIPVDVRVLAATNKDLDAMSREGSFRVDLLYRLTPMRLYVPPLKDRPAELRPLVAKFIDDFNRKHRRSIRGVSADAMEMLEKYDWPGNVRELRNEIERAVVMAPGDTITPEVLPVKIAQPTPRTADRREEQATPESFDLKARVRREEIQLIRAALGEAGDKRVLASQLLGIPRRTLLHKMREYGIDSGDPGVRLPPAVDAAGRHLSFADRMTRFEDRLIDEALARTKQDVTDAARLLRIQPRTLKKRMLPESE